VRKNTLLKVFIFLLLILGSFPLSAEENQPLVSLLLFETDLREALNEISLQTGVNIIMDQTVSGIVTADIQDLPLEKALQMLLLSGGFTYKKYDDFYFVGLADIKNASFTGLSELEVIRLNYVKVEDVLDIIPANYKDFVTGNRLKNTITINAPGREMDLLKGIIAEVDQPRAQVEIKVLVTEVDSRYLEEYGSDLFSFAKTDEIVTGFAYDSKSSLLSIQGDIHGQLLSRIRLLQEEKKASIEADPRIIIAEGETAELFIGDQQILLINSEDEDLAARIEKLNVGVGLKVSVERVVEDNIMLNIAPEISYLLKARRPDIIIKENSVSTSISLKNGQTIALAGMTTRGDSSYNKSIPYLNEIPLLRWLFSLDEKSTKETELLVFVTPVIR
jgi:type IV pilus assembly protein PilQ